ncbi:hypothetical protein IEQ34_007963 [Dendrobium chrysotoxum]|uniref:Uncharacterized protein n=1 Tax=Dendrobium chrysotoxum TaxID=161865 RepID=A0AAV7H2P9_DENCH|nr:hypothetical protein IEQ34_007963 [Dendrobium chrysotoxum]
MTLKEKPRLGRLFTVDCVKSSNIHTIDCFYEPLKGDLMCEIHYARTMNEMQVRLKKSEKLKRVLDSLNMTEKMIVPFSGSSQTVMGGNSVPNQSGNSSTTWQDRLFDRLRDREEVTPEAEFLIPGSPNCSHRHPLYFIGAVSMYNIYCEEDSGRFGWSRKHLSGTKKTENGLKVQGHSSIVSTIRQGHNTEDCRMLMNLPEDLVQVGKKGIISAILVGAGREAKTYHNLDRVNLVPAWDYGLILDEHDNIDILWSPFFDVGFDFDNTVEEYFERIHITLVDTIDDQRKKGRWIIFGRATIGLATPSAPTRDMRTRDGNPLSSLMLLKISNEGNQISYEFKNATSLHFLTAYKRVMIAKDNRGNIGADCNFEGLIRTDKEEAIH